MKPWVIALGGNALIREHEIGKYSQQLKNVTQACKGIASLIQEGKKVVITHGNGPQVGMLDRQMRSLEPKIPSMPLHIEVGMTQVEIGHLIWEGLNHWMPSLAVPIVPTHVLVSRKDKAFTHPSKPIGKWFQSLPPSWKKEKISFIHEPLKGYRRVVGSPFPQKILEAETIRSLLRINGAVIACGGGGIPIVKKGKNYYGMDAVIDKDASSQLLANVLNASMLVMLTDQSYAYTGFHSSSPKPIRILSLSEAKKHTQNNEFGEGSMLPKIQASIRFIQKGGRVAYIGKTSELKKVIRHEKGTRIQK